MMLPNTEVVERLGVHVVDAMGGRLRRHWLVDFHGEQLVLRRWTASAADVSYELRLLAAVAKLGWPVAPAVIEPFEFDGYVWCLFPVLAGYPLCQDESGAEQRARGRLLAEFHQDLAGLGVFGQREGWRRCEEILADPALDRLLSVNEKERHEEVAILRWHADRARKRLAALNPNALEGMIIHGDFTPWNLHFVDGRLTGILDFELSRWDHRVGDFALSWRGIYDDVIYGYSEVSRLSAEEWELLTPMWWASLIEGACRDLARGTCDDGWTMKHLIRRSPLMGPDAVELP